MLKTMLFGAVAAMIAATPAMAGGYWHGGHLRHWHRYPNYAAALPYGWPFVAYTRSTAYIPAADAVLPVRVYYIPQQPPYYNVPPYLVVAPY